MEIPRRQIALLEILQKVVWDRTEIRGGDGMEFQVPLPPSSGKEEQQPSVFELETRLDAKEVRTVRELGPLCPCYPSGNPEPPQSSRQRVKFVPLSGPRTSSTVLFLFTSPGTIGERYL